MIEETMRIKVEVDNAQATKNLKEMKGAMKDTSSESIEAEQAADMLGKVIGTIRSGNIVRLASAFSGLKAQISSITQSKSFEDVMSRMAKKSDIASKELVSAVDRFKTAYVNTMKEMDGFEESETQDYIDYLMSDNSYESFIKEIDGDILEYKKKIANLQSELGKRNDAKIGLDPDSDKFARINDEITDINNQLRKSKPLVNDLERSAKNLKDAFEKSNSGLSKGMRNIKQFGAFIKGLVEKLKKLMSNTVIRTLGIITLAVLAITKLIRNAFNVSKLGDDVDKASQKALMGSKNYQEWAYVLDRCGVEASMLQTAMKQMSNAQAKAATGNQQSLEAFQKLGIGVAELRNSSPEEMFDLTVKALQRMPSAVERTRTALQLFGRSASELNTVLNMTNDETDSLKERYTLLGATMSNNLVKTSAEVRDAITDLKSAWQGLGNTLGEVLLPRIRDFIVWLTKAVAKMGQFLQIVFGVKISEDEIGPTDAVVDYTESVQDAETETKKLITLISGFDELNRLTAKPESSGASSIYDDDEIDYSNYKSTVNITEDDLKLSDKWVAIAEKIQKHLDDILTTIGLIGAGLLTWQIAKDFIPNLSTILQTIGGLTKTILITLAVDFVLGKIYYDNVKSLIVNGFSPTKLIASIISGLGILGINAMAGAKIAGYLGASTAAGGWIGLAIGALILLTITGIAIADASRDKFYNDTELGKELKPIYDRIDSVLEKEANIRMRINEVQCVIDEDTRIKLETAQQLVENIYKYFNDDGTLQEQYFGDNNVIARIQAEVQALNDLGLDGIRLEFNKLTGKISATKDEVQKLIDKLIESARLKGLSENITENWKLVGEAAINKDNAIQNKNDLENSNFAKVYKRYQEWRKVADAYETKLYSGLMITDEEQAAYDKAHQSMIDFAKQYGMTISQIEARIPEFRDKLVEADKAVKETTKDYADAVAKAEQSEEIYARTVNGINNLSAAFIQLFNPVRNANGEITAYTDKMGKLYTPIKDASGAIKFFKDQTGQLYQPVYNAKGQIEGFKESSWRLRNALYGTTTATNKVGGAVDGLTPKFKNAKKESKGFLDNLDNLSKKEFVIRIKQEVQNTGDVLISTMNGQNNLRLNQMRVQAYASGGVIHKPTLAYVGEYQGASSNPEIITPESKMRAVFEESNGILGEIFIEVGRQIVEAIDNQETTVSIGDEQIAKSAARGNQAYKNRTGRPLLV